MAAGKEMFELKILSLCNFATHNANLERGRVGWRMKPMVVGLFEQIARAHTIQQNTIHLIKCE